MYKKLFITFLTSILLCLYNQTNSYSGELDFSSWEKSIRELKQDIEYLDETNKLLDSELDELNADYRLKVFLKRNLSLLELNRIKKLVSEYNSNSDELELQLHQKAKELLPVIDEKRMILEAKRKFYSWLSPYINPSYKKQYLWYIKHDAQIFNEQTDVNSNMIASKEILNTKVETIESRIQEYKDQLNKNLNKIIETRLEEKIQNLQSNESFQTLNKTSQIKVLEKTIEKVEEKLIKLEESIWYTGSGTIETDPSDLLNKKIQTYRFAVEKLEDFKAKLQQ